HGYHAYHGYHANHDHRARCAHRAQYARTDLAVRDALGAHAALWSPLWTPTPWTPTYWTPPRSRARPHRTWWRFLLRMHVLPRMDATPASLPRCAATHVGPEPGYPRRAGALESLRSARPYACEPFQRCLATRPCSEARAQHCGQSAARTATAGRARGLLRRRNVRDVRRHVGGVAQWIPSPL